MLEPHTPDEAGAACPLPAVDVRVQTPSATKPEQLLDRPVPDLAPLDSDGLPWPLRSRVGVSPLVIFFFTHHCTPGCQQELREFGSHEDAFRDIGVPLVGISLDSPAGLRTFRETSGHRSPLLSDPDRTCGNAFGVTRRIGIAGWQVEFYLRASFLVDRDGTIVGVWPKLRPSGHALELLAAAQALQAMPAPGAPPAATGLTPPGPGPSPAARAG